MLSHRHARPEPCTAIPSRRRAYPPLNNPSLCQRIALPILAWHFRRQCCTTPHLSLALHTSAKLCRFVTSQAFSSHIHGTALLRYSIASHFVSELCLCRSTHSSAITAPCVAFPLRIGSLLRFALPLRGLACLYFSAALHSFAHPCLSTLD